MLRDAKYTEEELKVNDAMRSKHIVRLSQATNNSIDEGDPFFVYAGSQNECTDREVKNCHKKSVKALVSIFFSWNNKNVFRNNRFQQMSATYSYVDHGTRMTLSSMFCVLQAAVRFAWWCSPFGPLGPFSPTLNTSLIHEYCRRTGRVVWGMRVA